MEGDQINVHVYVGRGQTEGLLRLRLFHPRVQQALQHAATPLVKYQVKVLLQRDWSNIRSRS